MLPKRFRAASTASQTSFVWLGCQTTLQNQWFFTILCFSYSCRWDALRRPQDAPSRPKIPHDAPKTPQDTPKTPPRCSHDAPKTLPRRPKDVPKTPRNAPRRPKTSQDASRRPRDASKTRPRRPKAPPRRVYFPPSGITASQQPVAELSSVPLVASSHCRCNDPLYQWMRWFYQSIVCRPMSENASGGTGRRPLQYAF